jgi:hypothetical protein
MYTHYWITTLKKKKTTKQHPLLGSGFLISKNTQQLLSDAFVGRHVPMEMIEVHQCVVFAMWAMLRHYMEDKWGNQVS